MGFFSRFPYTDFHRLNADWILEKIKEMMGITQEAAETVETYDDRLTAVETAAAGAVRFNTPQDIPSSMQRQARDNIGAASASALTSLDEVVWGLSTSVDRCVRTDMIQSFDSAEQSRARTNIGAASQTSLNELDQTVSNSVVHVDELQTFTPTEKAQARTNIAAASQGQVDDISDAVSECVRYTPLSLTDAQKVQARTNIGAAADGAVPAGAVRYDTSQSLYTSEKLQARLNIGAASSADIPTSAVLYTAQELTAEQKAQARDNIGAGTGTVGAVLYSEAQQLTELEQSRARNNINAAGATSPVISMGIEIDSQATALTVADAIQIFPESISGTSILNFSGDEGNTQLQTDDVILAGVADPIDPDHAVNYRFLAANTPPIPVAIDAGKVLVANNDFTSDWQPQQIKIFTGTVDTSTLTVTLDTDATYANMSAAVAAGQIVMLKLTTQAGYTQIYDLGVLTTSTAIFNTFSLVTGSGGSYTLYVLTVSVTSSATTYRQSTIQF